MYEVKIKKTAYEEIKIGDKIFRIDVSRDAIKKRAGVWTELMKRIETVTSSGTVDVRMFIKLLELFKEGINDTLEGNPADEILDMCGGDIAVLIDVANGLQGVLREITVKYAQA